MLPLFCLYPLRYLSQGARLPAATKQNRVNINNAQHITGLSAHAANTIATNPKIVAAISLIKKLEYFIIV